MKAKKIETEHITNECCMGDAQPPPIASMTSVEQNSNGVGSGDRWDNKNIKKSKIKINNIFKNEASNVNPYDKLGNHMLDKLKIPSIFDKDKDGISVRTKPHILKKI